MLQQKNVFLVDGVGALLSSLLLGILLPILDVGMPIFTLYFLAMMAFGFAVYSMSCHFVIKPQNNLWLKLIITANLCYCVLTLVVMIYHWSTLTNLGIAYFLGESLIIVCLVWMESRVVVAN